MPTNYWDLVEPVWDSLVQWDEVPTFRSTFELTEARSRTLFASHWLYSEVCNGGFHQFYWNSTGILAPEAADAFDAIGMPHTADVVRRSISWFPNPYPRERATRIEMLDNQAGADSEQRNPFDSLDSEFYDLVETENGGFVSAANAFASRGSV